MKIQCLVCNPDGTQTVEEREVPDDWQSSPATAPEPTPDEDRDALAVDHEYRLTALELGVNSGAVQNT